MVTIRELYANPFVVKRILAEVEKQKDKKFKDLRFLKEALKYEGQSLGFGWDLTVEGGRVWWEILLNSNFKPFNEFHGINEAIQPQIFCAGRLYKDEKGNSVWEQLSELPKMYQDDGGNWCIATPKHHTIIKREVTSKIRQFEGRSLRMGPITGNANGAEIKIEVVNKDGMEKIILDGRKEFVFEAINQTSTKIKPEDNIERFIEQNYRFEIFTRNVGPSEILQFVEREMNILRRKLKNEKNGN